MYLGLYSRRRGSVVAFALMALVAMLAIGLVLFSRARRGGSDDPGEVDPQGHVVPGAADEMTTGTTGAPPPVGDPTAPAEIQLPPPPPPASTPDTRDLPPEA